MSVVTKLRWSSTSNRSPSWQQVYLVILNSIDKCLTIYPINSFISYANYSEGYKKCTGSASKVAEHVFCSETEKKDKWVRVMKEKNYWFRKLPLMFGSIAWW